MQNFINAISPYWKAVIGFFLPGILLIGGIWANEGRMPTGSEWLMALGLSIVTSVGVWAVPNKQVDQGE
ncbi:MAG: hypothetical protein WC322_02890 [Candidatus Paceibacterota bacterium]|jgi:hypothetical protein